MPPSHAQTADQALYIGLMSGTSLDGVDGVLVQWNAAQQIQVVGYASQAFPAALRQELLALNTPQGNN